MTYLEIAKDKSVRIDSIVAVESNSKMGCLIYTPSGPFTSTLSYGVVKEILERYEKDNKLNAVLKNVGHFAG